MSNLTVLSTGIPDGLMVEFLQGPKVKGINTFSPEFGWIVHSTFMNDIQSAYHLLVASDQEMLHQNHADMWDSDVCISAISINIPYRGKQLQPNTSYYWKVKTRCKLGGESSWSDVMEFMTGNISKEYSTVRYPLKQTAILPSKIIKKSKGRYLIDFGKVAFGYLHLELMVVDNKFHRTMKIHLAERGDNTHINKKPGGNVRYHKIKVEYQKGANIVNIHPPRNLRNTSGNAIRLPEDLGTVTPFRYVEIEHCPVELLPSMVQQISIHYPFNESASAFESSDPILNDIWALCKYSMKATSFCGVYIDGDRERIPYEADAYINQLSHYAVDREYSLARYSHEYLLIHPTWPTEWKLHSILIAWADFMYTGNNKSIEANYQILKSKTLDKCAREDGLLNTAGMKDLVDWPKVERNYYEFTDVNTVVNAFYYKALLLMADIAAALEKKDDAVEYQQVAMKVKAAFNKIFFDIKQGVYVDGENAIHASLHANMMPLAFGLVPDVRKKSVADFVVSKGMACSVYGAQYLLEALYESGRPEVALARMTSKDIRSWYNMLRVGSTITLEAWDNQYKKNQDWNHAWGAVPGNIIPRFLFGVRPIEPGFAKVLIQPQPASLETASATFPTILGPIIISFKNNPNISLILIITIPVNMNVRVGLPQYNKQLTSLFVDGKEIKAQELNGFLFVDGIGSGKHVLSLYS